MSMFNATKRHAARSFDFGAEDAGLVGTPYFKASLAGVAIACAALMLSLWW